MVNYEIIYTDPPWPQQKGGIRQCRPNQGKALDYPTMSLPEIEDLHARVLADAAERHNVFLWSIDKYLFDAESMMRRLGYTLHARLVWDKENGVAPAFTVRFSHEYLLWFYKKGHMLMPCRETRGKYATVLRERSERHSQKPQCAYEMLENMFPGARRIELFARRRRPGWDCWGNEV